MLKVKFTICTILITLLSTSTSGKGLKEEFSWTIINYAWPENYTGCGETITHPHPGNTPVPGDKIVFPSYGSYGRRGKRQTNSPQYIGENNIPMGGTRYKDKIFVTVPRRRVGIPATLNYVSLNCKERHNVALIPYPNWEINDLNGDRPSDPSDVNTPFVSVYRTTVDDCDRLWFLDMGILEYPTGREQIQPMVLIVLDLKTNKIIKRYPLKDTDFNARSTLASVAVDVTKNTCDDAYAYMPDLVNYDLVVYSLKDDDSWVVHQNYFHMQPTGGNFDIAGYKFQWDDGVFSVALSKIRKDGFRQAYFHAMASIQEFQVSTKVLRNRTLATRGYHNEDFLYVGQRDVNGQAANHEIDPNTGVMFLASVNMNAVTCWDTSTPLVVQNNGIIQQDAKKMIYPSDLKLDKQNNIWVTTNSMPVFIYGRLNYDITNFRIWSSSIKDAIAGTVCDADHRAKINKQ